ncbi:hypothetical protein Plhal304r1_c017g0063181 [Plasmopara halstedii]
MRRVYVVQSHRVLGVVGETDTFVGEIEKELTAGGGINDVSLYCSFSKERSNVCDKYNFGKYEARGIIIKRDRYCYNSIHFHRTSTRRAFWNPLIVKRRS